MANNKKLASVNQAREFLDQMNALIESPTRNLIGSIDKGYVYKECDPVETYLIRDVAMTRKMYVDEINRKHSYFSIKDVIFNNPATIVFWADGTKTVVKCQDDELFDPEKGLAMAITKRALGDKGNYFETIKKWVGKYNEKSLYPAVTIDLGDLGKVSESAAESFREAAEKLQNVCYKLARWKIFVEYHNHKGEVTASAVLPQDYSCKSNATRAAKRKFEGRTDVIWRTVKTTTTPKGWQ